MTIRGQFVSAILAAVLSVAGCGNSPDGLPVPNAAVSTAIATSTRTATHTRTPTVTPTPPLVTLNFRPGDVVAYVTNGCAVFTHASTGIIDCPAFTATRTVTSTRTATPTILPTATTTPTITGTDTPTVTDTPVPSTVTPVAVRASVYEIVNASGNVLTTHHIFALGTVTTGTSPTATVYDFWSQIAPGHRQTYDTASMPQIVHPFDGYVEIETDSASYQAYIVTPGASVPPIPTVDAVPSMTSLGSTFLFSLTDYDFIGTAEAVRWATATAEATP